MPLLYSLDVRAERTRHKAHGDLTFYVDVQNTTLHRNVEGYEVDEDNGYQIIDTIRGLPILPMLGVEYVPR